MLLVLAAIFLTVGLALVYNAVYAHRSAVPSPPVASPVRGVAIGALVFLVGFSMLSTGLGTQEAAPRSAVQAALPAPTPQPVAAAPSGRTDLQNLAVVAGVSENDPELIGQYARLQSLCPPENASVGDMSVSLQRIVREESGRNVPLVDVMRQLATAQEGGAQAGMKCSETGGMLAELLIKGM